MHDGAPYGHLAVAGEAIPARQLAQMVGIAHGKFVVLLRELERANVLARTADGVVYSRRLVRDEDLRERRATGGIKSIEHPNTPKPKGTLSTTLQGSPEGRDGGPPPASAVAVASAESPLHGGASRHAEEHGAARRDTPTFETLKQLVRKHLYVPDGKPSPGWSEARDGSILKALLKRHSAQEVAIAIEGLALLRDHPGRYADAVDWPHWPRPGQKTDLRPLYNNGAGVLRVFTLATQAYWRQTNSGQHTKEHTPVSIGDVLRDAITREKGRP
jgi:hypothetical protein